MEKNYIVGIHSPSDINVEWYVGKLPECQEGELGDFLFPVKYLAGEIKFTHDITKSVKLSRFEADSLFAMLVENPKKGFGPFITKK